MRVKRFVGDSVAETVAKIKQDLGQEAIILQTRQFKEGGFLGLFGQSKVEITAALDDQGTGFAAEGWGTESREAAASQAAAEKEKRAAPNRVAAVSGAAVASGGGGARGQAGTVGQTGPGRPGTGQPGPGQTGPAGQPGPAVPAAGQTGMAAQTGMAGRAGMEVPAGTVGQPGTVDQTGTVSQPGAGGLTGTAGRAGMVGQPDPAGQAGITGRPSAAGQPDVTGQPGIAGQPSIAALTKAAGRTDPGNRSDIWPVNPVAAHMVQPRPQPQPQKQPQTPLGGVDSSTEKLLRSIAQARVQNALEEAARVLGSDQEGVTETADKAKTVTAPDAPDSMSSDIKELMHMIREIHHYLDTESGGAGFVPEVLQKWRDYLSRRGVSEALCREMMFQVQLVLPKEQWQDDRRVFAVLKKYILAQCSRTQALDIPALQKQDKPLVIALVGPTGVGKSTTIGKLSAGFSIVESRRVGLITADTYRVAAAEQLRTFGEILGIPVDVVMSASGLAESVARQRDKDVILIDTAGRSPNHVMHMGELAELMKAAQPDLTLLVISATTHPEEQALILEKFRPLSTHLVLTKLDESRCEGAVLDLMTRTDLPLTYLTNGQNVPDDIAVATPERLMGWILGQGAG